MGNSTESFVARNLFDKVKINGKLLSDKLLYRKYKLSEGERLCAVAEKIYGDKELEWVIIMTNKIINGYNLIILDKDKLDNLIKNDNKLPDRIYEYRTIKSEFYKEGIVVNEDLYNRTHHGSSNSQLISLRGDELAEKITYEDHYLEVNEKNSTIYLLKPSFIQTLLKNQRPLQDQKVAGVVIVVTMPGLLRSPKDVRTWMV